MGSLESRSTGRSPGKGVQSMRLDDEHKLIARYAARLAQEAQSGRTPTESMLGVDTSRAQRELISQLEAKNREIMREIARLRREQEAATGPPGELGIHLVITLSKYRSRTDLLEISN
jgi:hypothetical protein